MKKLPIGIQSIKKMIEEGFVYVDKTKLIHEMIERGRYYFMSRPRRFGKSLLVSTLKAIFNGEKELFAGCSIYSSKYAWEKHPIIFFDFTQIVTSSPEALEESLKRTLESIAKEYGQTIEIPSLQEGLAYLVKVLAKENDVVVLVDEYDKPIIDNLSNPEVVKKNRDLLKNFFGTLKGLADYLRLIFITGVSKFPHVSLFSGFNNLQDITTHPAFATLLGLTEQEIRHYFSDRLSALANKQQRSVDLIIDEMRQWYNGYRFTREGQPVYNPHSSLNYLDTGETENYWFSTGTPTFLIEQIRKIPRPVEQISCIQAGNEMFDVHDVDDLDLTGLMWQTGYLTIQTYSPSTRLYQLDYPNKEVRLSFFESLLKEFAKCAPSSLIPYAKSCSEALQHRDLSSFFKIMNICFAKIPSNLFMPNESFYHAIFLSILEVMGFQIQGEVNTNVGRIDLALFINHHTYIFEFKIDDSAKIAMQQIQDKRYMEKYLNQGRDIILVGVNFDSKSRNIQQWQASVFSEAGH